MNAFKKVVTAIVSIIGMLSVAITVLSCIAAKMCIDNEMAYRYMFQYGDNKD